MQKNICIKRFSFLPRAPERTHKKQSLQENLKKILEIVPSADDKETGMATKAHCEPANNVKRKAVYIYNDRTQDHKKSVAHTDILDVL